MNKGTANTNQNTTVRQQKDNKGPAGPTQLKETSKTTAQWYQKVFRPTFAHGYNSDLIANGLNCHFLPNSLTHHY